MLKLSNTSAWEYFPAGEVPLAYTELFMLQNILQTFRFCTFGTSRVPSQQQKGGQEVAIPCSNYRKERKKKS